MSGIFARRGGFFAGMIFSFQEKATKYGENFRHKTGFER